MNCNGRELEQVKTFKYLGTIIYQNGKIREEILNRTKKTLAVNNQLSQTIFGKRNNNKN